MSVVNIRVANLRKMGYASLEEWLKDPNHVYIGRGMTNRVSGARESIYCNPFNLKDYDIDECLKLYEQYIRANIKLMSRIKNDLTGKSLGCWCSPSPCHGDILLKILSEL